MFDTSARYATDVAAPPARVYATLQGLDLGALPVSRVLLLLRALGRRETWRRRRGRRPALTLTRLVEAGEFTLLAERPGEELVLGIVGRFWTLRGGADSCLAPADWVAFDRPGFAKAAWSFHLAPLPGGGARLSTETRVRCLDDASRRRFRRYWRLVGPFSGLIRREMLRAIRRQAERRGPEE